MLSFIGSLGGQAAWLRFVQLSLKQKNGHGGLVLLHSSWEVYGNSCYHGAQVVLLLPSISFLEHICFGCLWVHFKKVGFLLLSTLTSPISSNVLMVIALLGWDQCFSCGQESKETHAQYCPWHVVLEFIILPSPYLPQYEGGGVIGRWAHSTAS